MAENININVNKKKKNSLIPFLLVIIVILIGVIGILVDGKTKPEDMKNISQINDSMVDVYLDRESIANETQENISQEVKDIYEKFKDAVWISKNYTPENNIFYIENGKIICKFTENSKKEVVNLEYGNAKYVYNVKDGEVLKYIVILSDDGNVYKIDLACVSNDSTYNVKKLELEKISLESKVVDILINTDGMLPGSAPYYLTEDGEMYNESGKTYEQINKNHIAYYGSVDNLVFINKNKTMEVLRSNAKNEYLTILDSSGNDVIAKYVFCEISDKVTDNISNHFYVVDKNNRLLDFSSESIYIADEYSTKKVKKLNYDEEKHQIKISFEDNSNISIENIYQYLKLN